MTAPPSLGEKRLHLTHEEGDVLPRLFTDASEATRARLVLDELKRRGIDPEYIMRSCMPEAFDEDRTYLSDERDEALLQGIRRLLDAAKDGA